MTSVAYVTVALAVAVVVGACLVALGPVLVCNVRHGARQHNRQRHPVPQSGNAVNEGEGAVPFHSVIEYSPYFAPAAAAAGSAGAVLKVAVSRKPSTAKADEARDTVDAD